MWITITKEMGCPPLTLSRGYLYLLKLLYRKIKYIVSPIRKINKAIREYREPYTYENSDYASQIVCIGICDRFF